MTARSYVAVWLGLFAALIIVLVVLRDVLLPFVAGMAIAYFLDPLADRLERRGCSRTLATTLITAAFLIVIGLLILFVLPVLQRQIVDFLANLPAYFNSIRSWAQPVIEHWMASLDPKEVAKIEQVVDQFSGRAVQWVVGLFGKVWAGGMALVNFLALLFITPVVTFYFLRDWGRIIGNVNQWLPRAHAETIREQARLMDQTLASFVRGVGLVCLILATYYGAALSVAGLDFGLAVGVAAGLVSFVPYVGSIGGLVIGVGLAALQFDEAWRIAVIAGIFVLGQILEGWVLTPKLVGGRVKLHPVWVIFAVLAGGSLFGFVGMLISLPVAALAGVLVRFGIGRYLTSPLFHGPDEPGADDPPSPGSLPG